MPGNIGEWRVRFARDSARFGAARFDSVHFSQLADRALPRVRCTIHYGVLQPESRPSSTRPSLHSPTTLAYPPSRNPPSILLRLQLWLRPTTTYYYYSYYYYPYYYRAYETSCYYYYLLLLRTILLLSRPPPPSTTTVTIEAVPNICQRILSQLLMVPLQLQPELRRQWRERKMGTFLSPSAVPLAALRRHLLPHYRRSLCLRPR